MKVRKRVLIWSMTLAMLFSMLPFSGKVVAAGGNSPGATIYVATTGNDNTGDGTQLKPYKTIAKAKAVVRTLPKTGGDIVVQIADGFYSLDDTLVFNKDDSGSAASTIRYEAAPGAKPVISGGDMLEKGVWTEAVGLTQTGGLKAYKTTLNRSDKLRAIYVNDKRANMTVSPQVASGNRTVTGTPTVSFNGTDNPWAWQNGSNIRAAIVFDASVGLTTETKNPQNIEAESVGGSTARWARPFVTFASIEQAPAASNKPGGVMLRFQMPYAAISQSLSNNTQYNPGNNQVIRNAFEFLNKRGDFYFDQAESTLYYIPLEGEDINTADVIIPRLETVVDIKGTPVGDRLNPVAGSDNGRVKNITFDGLTFAHTDYKLTELTGTYTYSDGSGPVTTSSRGFASVQGAIVNTAYFPSSINWHETFYRSYDIPPAAVRINAARNIKVLNGEIGLAGFIGIHVENDAKDIEITGNYIVDTLASGIVIGHPQHIYENDQAGLHESSASASGTPIKNWAGVDKEKFAAGTEAVPENIYITNNFLYHTCYGFPGANALASFYTTNMQVLHNYIYDTTYGAMSIGWGWDEYDGFGFTAQGTNKTGGPYHGTSETSLARSKDISTTSRNNKINYNRIEEICTVVNDSGAIYSLGRQGDPGTLPGGGTWDTVNNLTNAAVTDPANNWNPDNWTNFTEMNYNFLNPNPTDKPTSSNNWTNGFHPDEGSTFIKFIGNVVQSKLSYAPGQSRLYEFNNWKRKSDMYSVGGYVDGDNNQNGAPRITLDNYKSVDRIWPVEGNDIVLNSGLANEYTDMIPNSLIADTEFELASNVILGKGDRLNRRGLLKAEDTVWLAPANTTVFNESAAQKKAAGNAKTINAPTAAGAYKLYIVYGDGTPTATSKYTVYVDASASTANVDEGQNYEVSAVQPLKLTLNGSGNTFTLNGNPVTSGYQIATEGSWTLVVSTPTVPNSQTINFTTTVSEANRLLPAEVSVAPGGKVRFAYDLDDASKQIWISSSSDGNFVESNKETKASGNMIEMTAPLLPGPYIIYVRSSEGDVLSQSHARIVVRDLTPVDIPRNGLDLWLKADEGVEKDSNGNVTGWSNMGSVPAKLAPANVPGSGGDNLGIPTGNPTLKNDVYDYVDFGAMSRPLKAAGFKDYNGKTQMTIYALAKPTATANNSSDQSGLVYFGLNEAYQTWAANSGWSGINLGLGTDRVNIRFGNTDGSVSGGGQQIATSATNGLVSVRAQLNGNNRSVFVNNSVIGTPGTNAKGLLGNSSDLGVGYTMSAATPYRFQGRVLQILIYDRVLTADEVTKIETYFNEVKAGRGGPANPVVASVDKTLLTGLIADVDGLDSTIYTSDSWNTFATALSEANSAVSNSGIEQQAADNSYYALRNAFKALVATGTIEPTAASFDKNVANQANVTTVMTLNGNSLSSIASGSTTLQLGVDYAVSGNTVTINKSYLGTLAVGTATLKFNFSGGATKELVITIADTTVNVPSTLKAALTGPSSVRVSQSFEAKIALEGVQENYNSASLVVHYDPAKLEFATVLNSDNELILDEGAAESLAPGVSIIGTGVIPEQGLIMIMLTSTSGHVPTGTADLLKLNAKAKVNASFGATTVTLSEFVVANADGSANVDAADAILSIQVKLADTTALLAAIQSAQDLHDLAVEGDAQGQYPAGSKAVLNTAINAARAIANQDASTQTDVDNALAGLNTAVQTFVQGVVGINKSVLNTAITSAEQLYNGASIGTSPGQYPINAASALSGAIAAANAVRNSTSVTQNQVDEAVAALNAAVSTFQNSVISQPPLVNKSALSEAIIAAESKLGRAVEGQKIGQYPNSAISAFNMAVQTAKTVFGQSAATQSQVDAAVTALASAQTTFAGQVVTLVPGQSAVTIRDLSIIAKYFNVDHTDPNWSQVEKADLFNNGKITIVELAAVARMIIGDWLKEHH
ncbi:X2-like carbohydrate binding domain-containing protein [Cohnella sp. GCM10012308]|uniref:X2-like carbohydrate binding domain-containing protein n=1 Tax=Cohnella sp. GCM10012308 TaxID=3317329 RepID=UPI00361C4F75